MFLDLNVDPIPMTHHKKAGTSLALKMSHHLQALNQVKSLEVVT